MNTRIIASFFMLLFGAPVVGAEPASSAIVIDLKGTAVARSRWVTVGDVADLKGGNAAVRERMAQLDLAEVPANGQPFPIKAKQVEFRLRLADFPASSFQLTGESESIVSIVRARLSPDLVQEAARAALLRRLPWPPEDLSIQLVQPIAMQLPQLAEWETPVLKAEPHFASAGLGRSQMDVTISVNGEKRLALPVFFETKLLQKVAICRVPLKKGDVLNEQNLFGDRRPVDSGNRTTIPYESVLNKKVVRPVAPGQTISSLDIEAEATADNTVLVRPRQTVKMVVQAGVMTVSATGEALQEGRMGQMIRVQNLDSKKVVAGKVTGPGTVEVEIGGTP